MQPTSKQSVIAFGNSIFQINLNLETTKLHKNHLLGFVIYTQNEKTIPFLSISLAFIKREIRQFFQIKWSIFRISLEKCRLFSHFLRSAALIDSCQKMPQTQIRIVAALYFVAVKMANCVIKVTRLRSSTLTVGNLGIQARSHHPQL